MTPKLIIINTDKEIIDLLDYIEKFEFIAFDTETTGLTSRDEVIGVSICAEENKAFYVIIKEWCPKRNELFFTKTKKNISELIKKLKNKKLIMHNGVFDCSMIEVSFRESLINSLHTDTMVLAHIINENRKVGLKELASNIFGEDSKQEQKEMKESVIKNGGKLTKNCYEMYKADSVLLAKYGAKDALLTYRLFLELVPQLYEQNLYQFFYEEESMPLLKGPTYELNTTGLNIDLNKLNILKQTLIAECLATKDFIYREIEPYIKEKYPGNNKKNMFNIRSNQQLSWLLFEKLNLQFVALTKNGKEVCRKLNIEKLPYSYSAKRDFIETCKNSSNPKYSNPWKFIACDKKVLQEFAQKYKWIDKLLEYQRKMKLLSTYVNGIEEKRYYGTVQPSFLQHGTTSGRYSSREPNFQNLPRDDKRVKECIISRPGKVFVGADYSQLEPRVFAFYSKDKRLLESFKSKDDFYSVIGMEVFDKYDCLPLKDGNDEAFGIKYKKLRDISKVIALSSTYGSTAHKLSSTIQKSVEETEEVINNYFQRFPGVKEYMLKTHEEVKEKGYVESRFGRIRRIPDAKMIKKIYGNKKHEDLPYNIRNLLNLAVNHKIQSTAASIVNRAAIKFNEYCKLSHIEAKLVLQVHDSLVAECKEEDADKISVLLRDAMENTIKLESIELEAIPKIGKNLSEI